MKYMLEYTVRHGLHHAQNIENAEALTLAFSRWKPEEGLRVHAFVSNLVGDKGYALVETEDPKIITSFVSKFTYWNDIEAIPVVDVGELEGRRRAGGARLRPSEMMVPIPTNTALRRYHPCGT